ncbi:non-structural maintenance of chromosomes element 3 homolog [Microplitis mediator]|uniref:non-structural maintenance of chromosomes element 3 homolog n=1 Tax=Microplitis mediator TaxID=375433 RepID=UPI0025533416|nr:non-structural maintenance of chromosomes element 3 homolog [Microplitis mediator]
MSQRVRRRPAASQAPAENLDHLSNRVLKYLLEKSRKKYAVKTTDIKKYALGKHADHFRSVINNVKIKLRNIYGYNLIHVAGAQYFTSNLFVNKYLKSMSSPRESAEQTLIFLVLGFIFMCAENSEHAIIVEDEIWDFFTNMNIISEHNSCHPYFGNVKELISDKFVKQLYLAKRKDRETDAVWYEWGPRANEEVDRRSVLKFVSKIYNRQIENFAEQYKAMKRHERSALQE